MGGFDGINDNSKGLLEEPLRGRLSDSNDERINLLVILIVLKDFVDFRATKRYMYGMMTDDDVISMVELLFRTPKLHSNSSVTDSHTMSKTNVNEGGEGNP